MKRFLLNVFPGFVACLLAIPVFAEETKITTVTTVETPGQVSNTVQGESRAANSQNVNVPQNYSSSTNDAFRSQLSITRMLSSSDGLDKNSARIEERSRDLNIEQKYMLLNQYKKDGGLPFAVNLILGLGIGSFIQGDSVGGWTGLLGELGSFALAGAGQFVASSYYASYSSSTMGYIMVFGGIISWVGFRVYELVRPWSYAKNYN